MPDDTSRILEPRERAVPPRPEFREELWDRLRQEALTPAPTWRRPGGPPWRRPNVRRIATIAAALLLGAAAVAVVVPLLGREPVRTMGDIPAFGPPPAFRATIQRTIPRASVQTLIDAIAGERLLEAPTVRSDQVVRLRLTVDGDRWRIDWLADSILEGDPQVAQLLDELMPDRSPGSYWVGGAGGSAQYSASTNTLATEDPFGGGHPLDLLSRDGTEVAAAFWDDSCSGGTLIATETVAGRAAHHVACGPWDTWIDAELGLLLRLELRDPDQVGVPVPGVIGMLSGETLEVTDIELEPELAADAFAASPPAGATGPSGPGAAQEATTLDIGDEVPGFRLPTIDGGSIDLAETRGRPTVLYLWATWCAPCLGPEGESDLLAVLDGTARRADLTVIAIASSDEPDAVRRQTKGLGGLTVALDADGASTRDLGSDAIPLLVLIDPEGKLAGAYLAGLSPEELRTILDAFATGDPLPVIGGDVVSQVPG